MFKGRAELTDPEKGGVVATFNETCHDDGTAVATVKLRAPITLQGTQRLEIFGTVTDKPMISVGASDPAGTEICEFHGTSAIGCIPDDTDVSLTKKTPAETSEPFSSSLGKEKSTRTEFLAARPFSDSSSSMIPVELAGAAVVAVSIAREVSAGNLLPSPAPSPAIPPASRRRFGPPPCDPPRHRRGARRKLWRDRAG
jgi:hypothetical protein